MLGANFEECKKILQKAHFQVIRKLGKGASGEVLLASKFSFTTKFYAIKCISLKKCAKDPHLKKCVSQQIQTMCALSHPNIIHFQKSFSQCGWHFIIMEYCDKGNLMHYQSKKASKVINFTEALKILFQITKGTIAIHSRNIIHRDIKCENIFLKKDKDGVLCKIGDFGFAKILDETAKTACGTVGYMAPEVMKSQPYSFMADVWSIGVVFYYMLFGEYPFKSINTEKQIVDKCSNGFSLFNHQSSLKKTKRNIYLQSFFMSIFEIDPKKRISLQQILTHPIFKSESETSSDSTTDDLVEQQIQWSLERINFITETLKQILDAQILQQHLNYAIKFYLMKVCRIFLTQENIKSYLQEQPESKLAAKIKLKQKQFSDNIQSAYNCLQMYRAQIKKIDRFKEGFNTQLQDFMSIKQGYRNTVGKVFQQIHSKVEDSRLKSKLKFRVFCCHLINRVFKTGVQEEVFPNFNSWKQKNNVSLRKQIDFNELNEWIKVQNPQNLLSEIDNINKIFYHKC